MTPKEKALDLFGKLRESLMWSEDSIKTNTMKKDKSWFILPIIAYTKYANGEKELMFGWLTEIFFIRF